MANKLILDTCALLWLTFGEKTLSNQALQAICDAPVVYVSPISAWEISLKVAQGDLELPLPPREWFGFAIQKHDLEILPLTVDLLIKSTELPWHHRDPADRIIIAGAMLNGLIVVTRDRLFENYDVPLL